jgi:uncharacterized membrane protein YphA (DoxX/SURF4 family)
MPTVFPDLLVPFLAPFILRAVVGLVFVSIGIRTWRKAAHLAHVPVPVVGARAWVPYLVGFLEICLGVMFLAGWYTQAAAAIGILGSIKYAAYHKWYPHMLVEYYPLTPLSAALIAAICVSLLVSGAGLHAFDVYL